ncbi:ERC protein 2-like isoform X2 [Thrips palmi]|uniref:ERC protein 2-like isoform X2 n=1 Tax=Thrips palmi TaxID=161013 RepID=A0A6P8YV94_THRPL|nr:ERC protein 2-like isoform X2 [Thrips palmi]
MESPQVEGSLRESWICKRGVSGSVTDSTSSASSVNMSEASGSSSSQSRPGPLPTKRTLSEPTSVRQMGPSPVKRQYQASNMQGSDDLQLKELDRLEKKEASLVNQLLHQLQILHKRCNEERHQIVEEQRHLAERLELIDANEKAEEQAVREKNERKLERVRLELFQLRQKMSLEGSSSNSSEMSSSVSMASPSTSGGQLDLSNVSDIRRRLGSLDRQRQTLLEQLYAAIGSLNQEASHLVDVQLHTCAPAREVAGSSTVTERGLPTSQQSEIAESNEQAQSNGEEDSEITSSSDVLTPQNVEILSEHASGIQESSRNQTSEANEEVEPEIADEDEDEGPSQIITEKSETLEVEASPEEEDKKKEEKEKDLALLKLKNIGSLVEEELQCSICNELLVAAVTINCAHSFCKHCLGEWKKQRAECPMCRMPITAEHRSVTLDSLISTMVGQLSLELQQRHKEVLEERAALEAAAAVAASSSASSSSSSSRQDGGGSSSSSGRSRHHNYNYNNNHWQPLPPPHHHHHHHHHHNGFVAHYPPHAHSHTPHAHSHTHNHVHNHAPHAHSAHSAHSHPPHAHVHPPLSQPPYHHGLPSLAAPTPRHTTPPPPRAPLALSGHGPHSLALSASSLQGLQGMAGSSQGSSQGLGLGLGPQGSQGGPQALPGSSQGQQGSQQGQGQPHDGRARRRHLGRTPGLVSSASSPGSSTEEPSYSSTGAFSSTSERTWFESDYGEYDDDENEAEPPIVPGIPGRYYGGYGVCFYCNQRGHWSNGCPVRFGF